jgi:enoyl-CoA hydratase/carnithine racemase
VSTDTGPFNVRLHAGVLELTLNTPACSHNIFSVNAAAQLCRILAEADPQRVAVILIKSGKPTSFINGVGLLMAGTAQKPEDIPAMTQGVTRAYRALRDFPAPSVAAIAGNCYGCGVEFALHCDYRLACESYETHFYMTEIADYLFIPAFGATQDLPRLLGMEAAADLLLWGERWSARHAAERGLVDASFEAKEFDGEVVGFLQRLAAAPRKRAITSREPWGPKQEAHSAKTRERIATLPPQYQPVYRTAHALMLRAATAAGVTHNDYAAEIHACSESVVRPIAKAAVAFFFIRQLATHYCLRGYELPETTRIAIDPADESLSALRREFTERRVRGLKIVTASATAHDKAPADVALEFTSVPPAGAALRAGAITTILQPRIRPQDAQAKYILYSPLFGGASRLVEIACDTPRTPLAQAAFALFDRAGYCPVLSRPQGEFATNLLLAQHLAPLISFVAGGGAAADVHASLREFGFVRGLAPLLQAIPGELLCLWVEPLIPRANRGAIHAAAAELACTTYHCGVMRPHLLDALLGSLGVFAIHAVTSGVVAHPALVDVMARELIDFPLMHGSLCRYLGQNELARLRQRAESLSMFFSDEFSARAARVLRGDHKFYNGSADAGVAPQAREQREAHA